MPSSAPPPFRGIAPPRPARNGTVPVLASLALLASAAAPAGAAEPSSKAGPVTIERPWSRATPRGATVAAGYLVIRNASDAPDRLVSATTEVADRTGPHSMTAANGVMEMRPLPDGIVVPPHGAAVLAPNGDHLMLEGLKHPLKVGEHFSGTLVFERAGPIPVTFAVESIGAKGPNGAKGPDTAAQGGTTKENGLTRAEGAPL